MTLVIKINSNNRGLYFACNMNGYSHYINIKEVDKEKILV